MRTVAYLVALGGLAWGGHAAAQVSVQQQQQQQFQAEQNRLGYEQQRQTQQYQAPAQQSYGFGAYTPYMHATFAATRSGKAWAVGFSPRSDGEADENAMRDCAKVASNEKCLTELTAGSSATAMVASYLTESKSDEVLRWFYGSSKESLDDAMGKAMMKCLDYTDAGDPHRCAPVVEWIPPAMPRERE